MKFIFNVSHKNIPSLFYFFVRLSGQKISDSLLLSFQEEVADYYASISESNAQLPSKNLLFRVSDISYNFLFFMLRVKYFFFMLLYFAVTETAEAEEEWKSVLQN